MPDDDSSSDRSVIRKCYWILCGQFLESDDREDKIKSNFVAIAIATAVLVLVASTSAFLVDIQNWPIALLLFVVGIVLLVFAWLIGLHRLDSILVEK